MEDHMNHKLAITLIIAHALSAALFVWLAYAWIAYLNPSLPLVPLGCMLLSVINGCCIGNYWAELDSSDGQ